MDKVLEKTKARLREAFPEMSEEEVNELTSYMRELAQLAIDWYTADQENSGKSKK